jgi:hypothetical protein
VRFSTRGVQKHHIFFWGKKHVNNFNNFWPKKLRFLFPFRLFPALLCVSQQGEFENTIKNFLGKIYVIFWPKKLRKKVQGKKKLLAEKVERKKTFFLSSFPIDFCFIAFLAVSLHEEPKNTIKIFSKIGPENRKKNSKKVGRYVAFFFFFGAPCEAPGTVYKYKRYEGN